MTDGPQTPNSKKMVGRINYVKARGDDEENAGNTMDKIFCVSSFPKKIKT